MDRAPISSMIAPAPVTDILKELCQPKPLTTANFPGTDVYAAVHTRSSYRLPDCNTTYRNLVSGLNSTQGALSAYLGRAAFYHLLCESSTQHLVFALNALLYYGMGEVVIVNRRVFKESGFPNGVGGFARQVMQGDTPFYTITLLERSDLKQGDLAADLAHECVHTLLIH
ncbi:hypothetical protein V8C42DRAFT_338466 [Trichoderma barbatum]